MYSNQKKKYACPDCTLKFVHAKAFATHRQNKHGWTDTGEAVIPLVKEHLDAPTEIATSPRNSTISYSPPPVDPVVYALAIGQAKEFCRNFAEEHGIATRVFTRQFAELFLREARR